MGGNTKQRTARLFEQQGGLCAWCGRAMILVTTGERVGREATLDHIVPRAHGGKALTKRGEPNLVAACADCNNLRADADPQAFLLVMAMLAMALSPQ